MVSIEPPKNPLFSQKNEDELKTLELLNEQVDQPIKELECGQFEKLEPDFMSPRSPLTRRESSIRLPSLLVQEISAPQTVLDSHRKGDSPRFLNDLRLSSEFQFKTNINSPRPRRYKQIDDNPMFHSYLAQKFKKSKIPLQTFLAQSLNIEQLKNHLVHKNQVTRNIDSQISEVTEDRKSRVQIRLRAEVLLKMQHHGNPVKGVSLLKSISQSPETIMRSQEPTQDRTKVKISTKKSQFSKNTRQRLLQSSLNTKSDYTSATKMIRQKIKKLKPITLDPFEPYNTKFKLFRAPSNQSPSVTVDDFMHGTGNM